MALSLTVSRGFRLSFRGVKSGPQQKPRASLCGSDDASGENLDSSDRSSIRLLMTMRSSFRKFADKVATVSGRPRVFAVAFGVVLLWAATGPYFHFSDTWRLVINTGTTIIAFLMVFIINCRKKRSRDLESFAGAPLQKAAPDKTDSPGDRICSQVQGRCIQRLAPRLIAIPPLRLGEAARASSGGMLTTAMF